MANVQLNLAPSGLSGVLVPGDGVTFTATSESGDWPATTRLRVLNASSVETAFTPTIATTLATWSLTAAEVTALLGTKTTGSLTARITTGTGDSLRPVSAGAISILSKWHGVRSAQSLGTVTLGPAGPGIAAASVDINGDLVLTLDNSETLTPVAVPSLTAASDSAAAAADSASDASGFATAASDSASGASVSAGTATTQAGIATTKASEAAASAAAALVSENNAAATLASAVTLTGTQTITGAKTITAPTFVASSSVTYGSDIAPALSSWTPAGGAAWGGSSWAIPAGGSISTTITVESATYQIEQTRTSSSGGDMAVTLGSATASIPSDGNNRLTLAPNAGVATLTIGGGTWACTGLSAVSVRKVTATPTAAATSGGAEIRGISTHSIGYGAGLRSNTTGSDNATFGRDAGYGLSTGGGNTFIGRQSGNAASTAQYNTAVGRQSALVLTHGIHNTAIGHGALAAATSGGSNAALGSSALGAVTTGLHNVGLGRDSGRAITTGTYTVSLGRAAGYTDGVTATVATVTNASMLGTRAQATVSNVCVIGSALSSERQTLCLGSYDALGSDVRGGFALANASVNPTINPSGGGVMYASAGALFWRGSSGTITKIAEA